MSINITKPLRKCMFLCSETTIESRGLLCYEQITLVCYNCGFIGHSRSTCHVFYNIPAENEVPYSEQIIADAGQTKVTWSSDVELGFSLLGNPSLNCLHPFHAAMSHQKCWAISKYWDKISNTKFEVKNHQPRRMYCKDKTCPNFLQCYNTTNWFGSRAGLRPN